MYQEKLHLKNPAVVVIPCIYEAWEIPLGPDIDGVYKLNSVDYESLAEGAGSDFKTENYCKQRDT